MHSSGESNRGAGAPAGETTGHERHGRGTARGRSGRASQRIVDQLRVRIHEGSLSPGDRLPPERELCDSYGVSRVTVREALRVLEAGGLIDIRLGSHGGAFVTTPTAERVASSIEDYLSLSGISPLEIHQARLVLEPGMIPLVCEQAHTEDLGALARTCDELELARQAGRFDTRSACEFHLLLASATRNRTLDVLLRPLYEGVPKEAGGHDASAAAERTLAEHREILEALERRDAARATEAMRDHLHRMRPPS